jgi:hypothetical protein
MAPVAPKHINLGDSRQIENAFDACIIETMINKGFAQDFTLANFKLLAGIIACACVGYGYYLNHFTHRWSVAALCGVYFLVSWLLTFNDWWLEKDTIGIFYKKDQTYRITSSMDKYDRIYKLNITQVNSRDLKDRYLAGRLIKEYKLDVQDFFYENGEILSEKVGKTISESIKDKTL